MVEGVVNRAVPGMPEIKDLFEEINDAGELSYDQDQVEEGIKVLLDQMEDGHPVQVGVDYRSENGINHDKSTDHFVVLSSLHFDEGEGEFYFKF